MVGEDANADIKEYEDKIKKLKLPKEARETAEKELKKLRLMGPMSSEANIVRNYLDWILQIPWKSTTKDIFDLKRAQKTLS